MTVEMIILLVIGAFAGGFINGLAGFGTGLFALGFWLGALPAGDAVVLVVIMSLIGGAQGIYAVRGAIGLSDLSRFLGPALVGIAGGFLLLDYIDVQVLKLVVAALLVLFGGYFTFRQTLPKIAGAVFISGYGCRGVWRCTGRCGRAIWSAADDVVFTL